MKMFIIFENFCRELDGMVGAFVAGNGGDVDDETFQAYVLKCKEIFALETEIQELEESAEIIHNELEWSTMVGGRMDVNENTKHLDKVDKLVVSKTEILAARKEETSDLVDGPCQNSLDPTLKSMGVEMQPYHGACFIGNHCHTMLKKNNIEKCCNSIPEIVKAHVGDGHIYQDCLKKVSVFQTLFEMYATCHLLFNSAKPLSEEVIATLEEDIKSYMAVLRANFPDVRITPKLHIMGDHVIHFLKRWLTGCGFYGEQGGESLHAIFNKKKKRYSSIKKDTNRLTYLMKEYLASTNPKARIIRKSHQKKKRNVKRKQEK